ncbi:MAG TPA: hypothetical protein VMG98_14075 [Verrucomicrobiae bacterium]|nr:hypothetical protein [Verrucomicrobiae bacterium]
MRTLLAGSLFGLAILVAACGGGGKSGVVPTLGGNTNGGNQSNAKTTNAVLVLNIPAPNRQVSRRPFYVSPGTQSLGVLVVPATSTETPTPLNLTIFPVATPSPCAAASGGGYTCTLNVTAPIGSDNFFVGAFATASPNANAVPLSQYAALGITVSAGSGATPITFTLDGVVYQVVLTVPSADPAGSNTQIFPAGVAAGPLPLEITAYDSSNTPILTNVTNTFATPIAIGSPSPGGDGVSLSLNGATCSTITNGAVSIGCAADLGHVQFAYDGTPHPDASDHIVDSFTIASTTQHGNPTPSPAGVVLSSNVLTYQIPSANYTENAFLQTLSSGQLLYVAYTEGNALIGTFAPSTGTVGAPGTLSVTSQDDVAPKAVAVTSGNAVWVIDEYNYPPALDCWTSLAGGAASQSGIVLYDPTGEDQLYLATIAVDGADNLWYVGYDTETGQDYAGYFPESSACATPSSLDAAYTLTGDTYDSTPFAAPLASGIVFNAGNGSGSAGLYTVTTTSGSSIAPVAAVLSGGSTYGGGVGLGANGAAYASFYNNDVNADLETMASGGTSLATLLDLVPTSSVDEYSAYPYGLNVFSLNGVGDRVNYVDNNFQALGLIGNLQTTPATMLDALPNALAAYQSTHSVNGGEFVIYEDESDNLYIARAFQTTTWNVPATVIGGGGCGTQGLLSMNQRAPSSGPFTVTVAEPGSATLLPGSYNDYLLNPPVSGTPFTITVTDAGGRSETYNVTFNEGEDC